MLHELKWKNKINLLWKNLSAYKNFSLFPLPMRRKENRSYLEVAESHSWCHQVDATFI
jgi:muconolactone delta-isomerase